MLREIQNCRQVPKEPFRRWFMDQTMDLIVWYVDETLADLVGFQLCYDKDTKEHAVTWYASGRRSFLSIEDNSTPMTNSSPILNANGVLNRELVLKKFLANCTQVDPELVQTVTLALSGFDDQNYLRTPDFFDK